MSNFEELCKKNRYSQPQLARELGVSTPTVAKWWKVECFPRANLWKPLAEKLGVTIPELLEIFGTEG